MLWSLYFTILNLIIRAVAAGLCSCFFLFFFFTVLRGIICARFYILWAGGLAKINMTQRGLHPFDR